MRVALLALLLGGCAELTVAPPLAGEPGTATFATQEIPGLTERYEAQARAEIERVCGGEPEIIDVWDHARDVGPFWTALPDQLWVPHAEITYRTIFFRCD